MHTQEDDRPAAIFALSKKENRRPRSELGCQTGWTQRKEAVQWTNRICLAGALPRSPDPPNFAGSSFSNLYSQGCLYPALFL